MNISKIYLDYFRNWAGHGFPRFCLVLFSRKIFLSSGPKFLIKIFPPQEIKIRDSVKE